MAGVPHTTAMDEFDNQSPVLPAEEVPPVEIPPEMLSAEALLGVIEAYVLREGTDYGAVEHTHEEKVAQVRLALNLGKARIYFDPLTESVTLQAVP